MYRIDIGARRAGLARLAGALAAAGIILFACGGVAQAAPAGRPGAELSFRSASVRAGVPAVLTYLVSGVPAGSVIYLQRAAVHSHAWRDVGRMTADSGTVAAPADPAGRWKYRVAVSRGGVTVAASAPSRLTVTSAPSGHSCVSCAVKAVLPWLTPFIEPIIESVVQQLGPTALAFLGTLLGF